MGTINVDKHLYSNFLKKAEEFLESAKQNLENKRWNAAVVNSIHAGISSADALTTFFYGVRSKGERHEEVTSLIRKFNLLEQKSIQQLQKLISIKNKAEYEDKLLLENDAIDALNNSERFLKSIKEKLGK